MHATRSRTWAARCVPPPTVPVSIDGMVHAKYRSSPLLHGSMLMMQLDDSTFCAGSCPVAMNIAVTIFEACALKPPGPSQHTTLLRQCTRVPMEPAIALPTRFLATFSSTNAGTVVFSTSFTTSPLTVHSATTDFPLRASRQAGLHGNAPARTVLPAS